MTLDDPAYSPRECYSLLATQFNDERITIDMPDEAIDIEGYDSMDPNEPSRIRIHRDWTWIKMCTIQR